ncbi:hypothetical protein QVD17_04109 [Tagetes erecta]|uniref:Uncharacterized protein n=1 Tax=Tagetes erecta TaxID=13708 RepID=A0AAD8PAH7_TARER|nr:hypothetical protein QVD17_04109 [Tagetes erecta]
MDDKSVRIILSSNVDQKFQQPSPFVSLNNLKLYPERVYWCFQAPKTQAMSTELKSYLLGGSSTATLTMVLPEEVQAQKLLAEIRMLIENENNNFKITMARIEREKTHVESHEPKKPAIGGHMAQIKNCLEMLGVQLQHRKKFASLIITKLQVVEELIASLPASNKAKIEPCLISLRAQAGVTISKIIDCMKIHCDESQIRSSVLFCEPATTLEPSL